MQILLCQHNERDMLVDNDNYIRHHDVVNVGL